MGSSVAPIAHNPRILWAQRQGVHATVNMNVYANVRSRSWVYACIVSAQKKKLSSYPTGAYLQGGADMDASTRRC